MENNKKPFCNYCKCYLCKNGIGYLYHAKTANGDWICNVCYDYEVCKIAQRNAGELIIMPCEDENCKHRPKLISDFEQDPSLPYMPGMIR